MKNIILLFVVMLVTNITFSQTNLALTGTATASTETQSATNAIDGNPGTRWESAQTDIESWTVDLGSVFTIDRVIIIWEGAYGSAFDIEVSTDNSSWTSVYNETAGNGGTDDITFTDSAARYVRYSGTDRGTPYGHSFYEFEVYEAQDPMQDASLSDLTVNAVTLNDFSTNVFTYDVELPIGTTVVPTVGATTTEGAATTNITDAPSLPGITTILVTAPNSVDTETYTVNFTVEKENLAENKPAFSSSDENTGLTASSAVDGNDGTRWACQHINSFDITEWMYVDLGASVEVTGVLLKWQGLSYATEYKIQTSLDGLSWNDAYTETNGTNGDVKIDFAASSGRYVRIDATKKFRNVYGISLYEFEVYGNVVESTWTGATSSDWNTPSNWGNSTIPNALSNVVIPSGTTNTPVISSTTGAAVNDITISSGAVVTINHGGSIIVFGTPSGEITYEVSLSGADWHLVTAPVIGETYNNAWVTANDIAISTNDVNRKAIATYARSTENNTGSWNYFTDASGTANSTFNTARGYTIKRNTPGNISFTGTIPQGDMSTTGLTVSDNGGVNENKWNFVGNPYPAYLDVETLLSDNSNKFDATAEALYVWNGSSYAPITTGYIHPGQAFFINIKDNLVGVLNFKEEMLSNQTGVTYYRSSAPTVTLTVSNGEAQSSTEISYLEGKTTGLDSRFDLRRFSGEESSLAIYSHLISGDEGINLMKQALPQSYSDLVIPVGVKAELNETLTFTADAYNLPEGLSVMLEDTLTGTTTNLSEPNAEYTITNQEALDRERFNVYTQEAKSLSTEDELLDNVSIYKASSNNLRITGLNGEQSLELFSISGQQLLNTTFSSNGVSDIVLPGIPSGVYLVKITNDSGTIVKKIIW